jgi:hypothetical protein
VGPGILFIWARTCTFCVILLHIIYILVDFVRPQLSKEKSACDVLYDYLTYMKYFSLGLGMLDPEVIRKTHPRLILDISKAVRIGYFFLETKA